MKYRYKIITSLGTFFSSFEELSEEELEDDFWGRTDQKFYHCARKFYGKRLTSKRIILQYLT